MRQATSVKEGWVVVGLILLVSGLAGFHIIISPAYAQTLENGTADRSIIDSPSIPLQNQLMPDQDSLIANPVPSPDALNPPQQNPSVIGGDERDQETLPPNSATSPENTAGEQSLDTGVTIENSIVQNPAPGSEELENSQPVPGEQIDQPRTDRNDETSNSEKVDQQGNQEAEEENDREEDEEEDEEDEEEDKEDEDGGRNDEIPSSLRNWLPFP